MSKLDELYEKYEDEHGRGRGTPIMRYDKAYNYTVKIIEEIVAEILAKLESGQFFHDIRYNWITIDRKKCVAFLLWSILMIQEVTIVLVYIFYRMVALEWYHKKDTVLIAAAK